MYYKSNQSAQSKKKSDKTGVSVQNIIKKKPKRIY